MDYPLDESGQTLRELSEREGCPARPTTSCSGFTRTMLSRQDSFYTHYRIMDINGDGVKDLLRSGDGESLLVGHCDLPLWQS